MQIVVTLSEREYNLMKHFIEQGMGNAPMEAICNGQVLPKGHGRLIDADKLLDSDRIIADSRKCHYIPMIDVYQAPTIIEADKAESEEK